jgi:hypothetical protein
MDMTRDSLCGVFPSYRIHAPVRNGEIRMFALSETLRAHALLRVRREKQGAPSTENWVPFLVDTGAPSTHFTQATITALALDTADHISVSDKRVLFQTSTGRFSDINLLGTDVLQCGRLVVDYPKKTVDFTRASRVVSVSAPFPVWVKMGGRVMQVTPSGNDVYSLTRAVKAELEWWGKPVIHADKVTVTTHGGTPCDDVGGPLEANTSKTPYSVTFE